MPRIPASPVILDSKRGDIGSTAQHYATEAFDRYGADAVTANPYLGRDSVQPFLDRADRGVVILCRTSNPGAGDLQDLEVAGRPLYQHVAEKVGPRMEWPRQLRARRRRDLAGAVARSPRDCRATCRSSSPASARRVATSKRW
jgi:orotidine 5'-phosphate decarboxylase subfamily 2